MTDPTRARLGEYDHGDLRDALRAVLDLHTPLWSNVAKEDLCEADDDPWPCPTRREIAEHLGVTP